MMYRILSWIRERIGGNRASPNTELRQTGVRVRPLKQRPAKPMRERTRDPKPDLRFESEIGGRIEDAGPGKNVLVRSKYIREDTGTHDTLKIIDEATLEVSEDEGIDPYNTGRFDRSASWNNRSRK